MTEFFAFENLTWPEVAALRRDTPLLLPLGQGYDEAHIAEALGAPERAAWLPALPFGWRGCGLAVPEALLAAYLRNLLESMREDGFSRVFAVTPPGIFEPNIHAPAFARLTFPAPAAPEPVFSASLHGMVVLIPIGHTEQHGHHLPLSTDTLIIDAIARGAAAQTPGECLALPAYPYGVSTHRSSFAGTFNAGGRAFEDFWLGVIDLLVARGADRIYLISGHGGNCSFLTNVVKYAGERYPQSFIATTWLHTSDEIGLSALKAHRKSDIGGMGHAGELETSMILHLRPDLVHMERCIDEVSFKSTRSYYMDWVEGGALVANPPWDDDTRTGAYGAGSVATAEHGAIWLDAAIEEKVDHVRQIQAQWQMRRGQGQWRVV